MKSTKQASDKFQIVTDRLIALIEQGVKPWIKPWHSIGYGNLISGHQYRGINPLICAIDALTHDYQSPYFLGFSQASEMGWSIKKGSKSTWLRWGGVASKETEAEDGLKLKEFFQCVKWLQVFNADCLDDSRSDRKLADHLQALPAVNTALRSVSAESFIAAQNATTKFVGNVACYDPHRDAIAMPCYESFTGTEGYYATLIHELTHWTGHSSRCDRDLSGKFGTQKYAAEELIAELGAAFVCNELRINCAIEHHASYLDSWLQVLKADNKAFFKAANSAQKAATFLMINASMIESHEVA